VRALAIALAGCVALAAGQAPQPVPPSQVKAQYDWGYASPDGQGKGTLNILVDPAGWKTIIELQGLGERLLLLTGSPAEGFHLLIPRREVDQKAAALSALSLPFLPRLGSPEGLYQLLTRGEAPGVTVTRRDKDGPVKLRYEGKDDRGRELTVWLARSRWERPAR